MNLYKKYKNWRKKYKKEKRVKLLKKYGKEALYIIKEELDLLKISYWLEAGTLLGAVREKNFISGDDDIDISVNIEDYSQRIRENLKKRGVYLIKEYLIDNGLTGREETYEYKGIHIDIFYNTIDLLKQKTVYHAFVQDKKIEKDESYVYEYTFPFEGIIKIPFLGKDFKIPKNYHEYLKALYGEEYMIPIKNWEMNNDKNYVILENKLAKIIRYKQKSIF